MLQIILEFIMICTFCFKIFVIIQNGSLSFVEIVRLYFFHFLLTKRLVKINKLKIQHCFLAINFYHFFVHQVG